MRYQKSGRMCHSTDWRTEAALFVDDKSMPVRVACAASHCFAGQEATTRQKGRRVSGKGELVGM